MKHEKYYSKTCVKRQLSRRPKIGFQDQLSPNVGQKYCRMLQGEHSAILPTFIKLPFVIKFFVMSIFEWPFNTGFTVPVMRLWCIQSIEALTSQSIKVAKPMVLLIVHCKM